jgi:hypothetical protein
MTDEEVAEILGISSTGAAEIRECFSNQFNSNFKEKHMSLQNVLRMSVITHLESGPLGSYLSGLASALGEQHYA